MANGQDELKTINDIISFVSDDLSNSSNQKIIVENNKDGNIYTVDSDYLPKVTKEEGYVFSTVNNENASVRNSNVRFKILIPDSKFSEIKENLSCDYHIINNDPNDENSIKIVDLNIPGCVSNYDMHNISINISKPNEPEFKTNNYRNIKFIIKDKDKDKKNIETNINLIVGFFATESGSLSDDLNYSKPINFSPYRCNVVYDISLGSRNKAITNINRFEILAYEKPSYVPKNNIILNSSKLISSDNTIAINGVNASNAVSSFLMGHQNIEGVNNVFSLNTSSKYEIDGSISSNAGYIATDNGLHVYGNTYFYNDAGKFRENKDGASEFKPYITMSDIEEATLSGVTNSEVLLSAKNFTISNFVPLSGNAYVENTLSIDNAYINKSIFLSGDLSTANDVNVYINRLLSANNCILNNLSVDSNALITSLSSTSISSDNAIINDSLIISGYIRNGQFDNSVCLDQNSDNNNMSKYSHAEGHNTIAVGDYSHAEGGNTTAQGSYSHTEGYNTKTRADYSHAEGVNTTAQGSGSHAEGVNTIAQGSYSHAEGHETSAYGDYSHAEGRETSAYGDYSHAEGHVTKASGYGSHAEGYNTTTYGTDSHAEGNNTTTFGAYSHAEGYVTKASGYGSHAEGYNTTAFEGYSHAEGFNTTAQGDYSHAEGYNTFAYIMGSHAEGHETSAYGGYSHAEGYVTKASGYGSHAEGHETSAYGDYSHAEGHVTKASGYGSHAEGYKTTTYGTDSHAEGHETSAYGDYSHAEGEGTVALGGSSHVAGFKSKTNEDDKFAFSWNGDDSYKNDNTNDMYPSHGIGTFNINPADGTNGFYIGNKSLQSIIDSVISNINNKFQIENECQKNYPTGNSLNDEDNYPGLFIPISNTEFRKLFIVKQVINGSEYHTIAVSDSIYTRNIDDTTKEVNYIAKQN